MYRHSGAVEWEFAEPPAQLEPETWQRALDEVKNVAFGAEPAEAFDYLMRRTDSNSNLMYSKVFFVYHGGPRHPLRATLNLVLDHLTDHPPLPPGPKAVVTAGQLEDLEQRLDKLDGQSGAIREMPPAATQALLSQVQGVLHEIATAALVLMNNQSLHPEAGPLQGHACRVLYKASVIYPSLQFLASR